MNRTCLSRVTMAAAAALLAALIPTVPAQPSKEAAAPPGNAQNGKQLFMKIGCYECHGRDAQGSTATGPRLGPHPIPFANLVRYVRHPTGQMPPYTAKVVKDSELADIYAFLQALPAPPPAKDIPLLNE